MIVSTRDVVAVCHKLNDVRQILSAEAAVEGSLRFHLALEKVEKLLHSAVTDLTCICKEEKTHKERIW